MNDYEVKIYKTLETQEGETYRPDLSQLLRTVKLTSTRQDLSDKIMSLIFETEDTFGTECTDITTIIK